MEGGFSVCAWNCCAAQHGGEEAAHAAAAACRMQQQRWEGGCESRLCPKQARGHPNRAAHACGASKHAAALGLFFGCARTLLCAAAVPPRQTAATATASKHKTCPPASASPPNPAPGPRITRNETIEAPYAPGHRAGCRARGSRAPSRHCPPGYRPGRCGCVCAFWEGKAGPRTRSVMRYKLAGGDSWGRTGAGREEEGEGRGLSSARSNAGAGRETPLSTHMLMTSRMVADELREKGEREQAERL